MQTAGQIGTILRKLWRCLLYLPRTDILRPSRPYFILQIAGKIGKGWERKVFFHTFTLAVFVWKCSQIWFKTKYAFSSQSHAQFLGLLSPFHHFDFCLKTLLYKKYSWSFCFNTLLAALSVTPRGSFMWNKLLCERDFHLFLYLCLSLSSDGSYP